MSARLISALIFLSLCLCVFAQKKRDVAAEYTYYAPENLSLEEAKKEALNRAKIQAIADAFGTFVSKQTSLLETSKNGNSNSMMVSLSGADVKGEWLATKGEPEFDISYSDGHLVVTVRVRGVARAAVSGRVEYVATPLKNGTEKRFAATEFHEGDDLYLYFRTPSDGYLVVFLLDEASDAAYCMLPYSSSDGEPAAVKNNVDYVFFSEANNLLTHQAVDEYTLTLGGGQTEFNVLYVLFCPTKFTNAMLEKGASRSIPKNMSARAFAKWLSGVRQRMPALGVTEIPITIMPLDD